MVVAVGLTCWLPVSATAPIPGLMLAVVALLTFHVKVVPAPGAIEVDDADRLALGALGVGGLVVPPCAGEVPVPPQPLRTVTKKSAKIAKQTLGSRTTRHLDKAALKIWSEGLTTELSCGSRHARKRRRDGMRGQELAVETTLTKKNAGKTSTPARQSPRRGPQAKREEVLIPDKLYFRIGEVAKLCRLPAYVLRFWETEFPQLKPTKSNTGQRMYRQRDLENVLRIKKLLYDEGYTIAGARQQLRSENKATKSQVGLPFPRRGNGDGLKRVRQGLQEILGILSSSAKRRNSERV